MARNGKIARLPYGLRSILNRKLRDGEPGTKLVEWLNGLPVVQEVMIGEFGGRPINEQNLTEWKQGGYEDWLQHEETRRWFAELADEAAELEEDAGDISVADWLSASVAVALGRCLQTLAAPAANDPKQRQALLELSREIGRLRRDDHDEQRVKIERERRDAEVAAAERKYGPDSVLGPIGGQLVARNLADLLKRDFDKHGGVLTPEVEALLRFTGRLPAGRKEPESPTGPKSNQSESN